MKSQEFLVIHRIHIVLNEIALVSSSFQNLMVIRVVFCLLTEEIPEVILDEHMDLLRALEMSRLQFLRDKGLLHEPEDQR